MLEKINLERRQMMKRRWYRRSVLQRQGGCVMCKRGCAGNGQCWVQSIAQKLGWERRLVAGQQVQGRCVRREGWGILLHVPITLPVSELWQQRCWCRREHKKGQGFLLLWRWGTGDNGITEWESLKSISGSGMTDPCHRAWALKNSDLCKLLGISVAAAMVVSPCSP